MNILNIAAYITKLKETAEVAENSALAHKNIINSEGASSSHTSVNTVLSTVSGFVGSLSQIWEKNPGLEVHPFKNITLR